MHHVKILYEYYITFISIIGLFVCNFIIRRDQKFGPPDFPGMITFQTPQKCTWVLYGGLHATLKFMYFDVPESDGCRDGNVKLYNSFFPNKQTLIKTLCGPLSTEARTVNISAAFFRIELNVGSNYGSYRGLHAVMENNWLMYYWANDYLLIWFRVAVGHIFVLVMLYGWGSWECYTVYIWMKLVSE